MCRHATTSYAVHNLNSIAPQLVNNDDADYKPQTTLLDMSDPNSLCIYNARNVIGVMTNRSNQNNIICRHYLTYNNLITILFNYGLC